MLSDNEKGLKASKAPGRFEAAHGILFGFLAFPDHENVKVVCRHASGVVAASLINSTAVLARK